MRDVLKTIAHVKAGDPPASVKTLADWIAWRVAENQRMERELERQREAYSVGLDAMCERDATGAAQH